MPGVIQCEIMAQACALLLGDKLLGNTAYYTGMDKIKFKNKIVPGDTIEVSARLNRRKEPFYFAHAEAKVDGRLCCEGELSFALVEGR